MPRPLTPSPASPPPPCPGAAAVGGGEPREKSDSRDMLDPGSSPTAWLHFGLGASAAPAKVLESIKPDQLLLVRVEAELSQNLDC